MVLSAGLKIQGNVAIRIRPLTKSQRVSINCNGTVISSKYPVFIKKTAEGFVRLAAAEEKNHEEQISKGQTQQGYHGFSPDHG